MHPKKKLKNTPPSARQVEQALRSVANKEKAIFLAGFLQAYPGGYGEGDKFLGIVVPDQRRIAKQFRDLPRGQLSRLLQSSWHECRSTAVFILVDRFERADDKPTWCEFYLDHLESINNWDLVDGSAAQILGAMALIDKDYRKHLHRLSRSGRLWQERIAVVATFALIRALDFELTLQIAEGFLNHSHDLIHKAAGWMLRETGKRDPAVLMDFLDQHAARMPRTMLRYSLEKFPPPLRKSYMLRQVESRQKPPALSDSRANSFGSNKAQRNRRSAVDKPVTYFAFLRAVNVCGRTYRMAEIMNSLAPLQLVKIQPFLASGNLVVESFEQNACQLQTNIEQLLQSTLGVSIETFLRSTAELRAIVQNNPFSVEQVKASHSLHVVFVREPLSDRLRRRAESLSTTLEQIRCHTREIYWLSAVPMHQSSLRWTELGKDFKRLSTARNLRTLDRLWTKFGE